MITRLRYWLSDWLRPPKARVSEIPDKDPRGWSPDDGAGYIPTEEGGGGRDTPSADGISIPSSVDPDADPLGECDRCGQPSRRAYSKGLCPDCISLPGD